MANWLREERMGERIKAFLVGGRIIVLDRERANTLYFREGFYGRFFTVPKPKTPDVKKELELSPFDALYLLENGVLELYDEKHEVISIERFKDLARKSYENFDDAYAVYKDLRGKGYVVKSGLKFGSTFAVYKVGPGFDHAPFLVHVLAYDSKLDPLEIIRAGRLSHSVRKKFLLAYRDPVDGNIRYFIFRWLM
ncbi:MAG: tRNA-intron lyase [Infirmifilum sp.]|uniref:tRNA-intron lyase n=1 Tax=Infirmifilum TaxID=2856573 RepID=UPI001EEF4452|nr:tRNA-intron lyase [Infirmifilum uzonense]